MRFFLRFFVPFHNFVFRLTRGRALGEFELPVLLLTTTGRRSGKQRTIPLLYLEEDGTLMVVASMGGAPRGCPPGWIAVVDRGLGQPLQRLACGLASGVAGDHVPVLPAPLVQDRRSRRSCGHHPPGHADAAAVAGEVFAQAGGSSSGTNPVGQRLAVGLDSAQGAGGGLGERHCRRVRLMILALLDREAGRPVRPEFHVAHGQCRGFRSPQTAIGHHSNDCQVNAGPTSPDACQGLGGEGAGA